MGSGINVFWGIRDQDFTWYMGSGITIFWEVGIKILAMGLGSQLHQLVRDHISELNENLDQGINFYSKNKITSKTYTISQP